MLLINFSKKASVVSTSIKTRMYLVLFSLLYFQPTDASNLGHGRSLIAVDTNSIEMYEQLYHYVFWILCVVIVGLSGLLYLQLHKNPSFKFLAPLQKQMIDEQQRAKKQSDQTALTQLLNHTLRNNSKHMSVQLREISNQISNRELSLKSQLSVLGQHASEIYRTTEIVKKYIT